MTRARHILLFLITGLLFVLPFASQAADTPPRLAEQWSMVPKQDQREAFYEGLKEHMKVRAEAGDPWVWRTYTPMLGEEIDRVAVRYCCFDWADKDSYREWSEKHPEVQQHWNEKVDPHVASYGHFIDEVSWANSNVKAEWGPWRYFGVTEFSIKPGMQSEFDMVRDKISQIALNQGWATPERPWMWAATVGGAKKEMIVSFYKNYAEMEPQGENFFNFLSRILGGDAAAEEIFKTFSGTIAAQEYQIWELHEDLSMQD